MEATVEISAGARSILDAATEAFARAGFDSVSIADIAMHARVSKANIFHHFKSKEALFLEVLREACKGHAEFTEALLARTDLSSVEKLRQLIAFDFQDLFGNVLRSHLVIREALNAGCRTGRNLIQPIFMRNFRAVTGLIRQGQMKGEFRADLEPAIAAWMIGSTTMMFFQNREILGQFPGLDGVAGPKDYATKVYRTILNGLACASVCPTAAVPNAKPATKPRKRVQQ